MLEFAGAAVPLAAGDIVAAAASLGVEAAALEAVADVESEGGGFLIDGRPKILFEAHVFHQKTLGRWDRTHPNISAPVWDPALYGAAGAHQYDRLHEAIALDRAAALQSTSWGRFQVMGENGRLVGWPDTESFVAAMCQSEAEHLKAFIGYCRANGLARPLLDHDWRKFALRYNGAGQVDHYAAMIAAAFQRHTTAAGGAQGTGKGTPAPTGTPAASPTPAGAAEDNSDAEAEALNARELAGDKPS